MPAPPSPTPRDFSQRPFVAIWEMTQACQLACRHCRADARTQRSPFELTTEEAQSLLCQVRAMEIPVFVLTGGDPLERPDLEALVAYGTSIGVRVSITPSATPRLTQPALARLKDSGIARVALSLDGSAPAIHDHFRGVEGSFARTLDGARWVHELGLPLQINSSMSRFNRDDFDALAELVESLRPQMWSVFFLIPTGRAKPEDMLSAEECEELFVRLYRMAGRVKFAIKTTEAMHYRRYVMQQQARAARTQGNSAAPKLAIPGRGINDGQGFVFISHTGDICPSGFLPRAGGNIRRQTLAEVYRTSPLFQRLRDADQLGGKCGVCEFRHICGGSRARAYALTGDVMAFDPSCAYEPPAWREMLATAHEVYAAGAAEPSA